MTYVPPWIGAMALAARPIQTGGSPPSPSHLLQDDGSDLLQDDGASLILI